MFLFLFFNRNVSKLFHSRRSLSTTTATTNSETQDSGSQSIVKTHLDFKSIKQNREQLSKSIQLRKIR